MAELAFAKTRRRTIAMKVETTFGVDVFDGTVVAGDVLTDARNIQVTPQIENFDTVPEAVGFLGTLSSIPLFSAVQVTFEMPIRGRGVAYASGTRPFVDLPLRGCGLLSTVDATVDLESVTYDPISTGLEAMTIYVMQENGVTYEIVGCFGDCVITWIAGGPVVAAFTFLGKLDAISAVALVEGTIATTPAFPQFKSADFQVGDPASVAAIGTLSVPINPSDTETVTIDAKVYTFQTTLTNVDGNVLIGATPADSVKNLVKAITLGTGEGTNYAKSMTEHPTVTAVVGSPTTDMDVTAKVPGTGANTLATTETLAGGGNQWGGATLAGGTGTDAFLARLQNLVFNFANTVSPIVDENAARAIAGHFVANRAPNGTFDPEMVSQATFDWFLQLEDAFLNKSSWKAGGRQYKRVKITVPNLQLTGVTEGDRGGARTFGLNWAMRVGSGNDDYSILFD